MEKEKTHIAWHPAFVEAIKMTLAEYQDSLAFLPEYLLSSEPLKIDCVIIKKIKDVEITTKLAAGFRGVNLLEYKSPGDYVSINDFYKVYGYACLYTSHEGVPFKNLTLTFVESRYPQKLIKYLKTERGYRVEENTPGIYTVSGDVLPIQIINNRKLSPEDYLWLRSLDNILDSHEARKITELIQRQDKGLRPEAYFNVLLRANSTIFEEVNKMTSTEFLQSTPAWKIAMAEAEANIMAKVMASEAKGMAEGEAKSKAEVLGLIKQGLSMEEIKHYLEQG